MRYGGVLLFGQEGAHLCVAEAFEFLDQLVIVAARLFDFLELDRLGQFRHHELTRVDHLQREVHSVDLAHAREQLHGEQRVAAEFEEILVNADGFHVEQFGPQGHQVALQRGARGIDGALRSAAARGGAHGGEDLLRRAQIGRDARVGGRARAAWRSGAGCSCGSGAVPAGAAADRAGSALRGGRCGRQAEDAIGGSGAERFQEEQRGAVALARPRTGFPRLASPRSTAISPRRATMRCSTPRPSARQLSRNVSTTRRAADSRKMIAPVRP